MQHKVLCGVGWEHRSAAIRIPDGLLCHPAGTLCCPLGGVASGRRWADLGLLEQEERELLTKRAWRRRFLPLWRAH